MRKLASQLIRGCLTAAWAIALTLAVWGQGEKPKASPSPVPGKSPVTTNKTPYPDPGKAPAPTPPPAGWPAMPPGWGMGQAKRVGGNYEQSIAVSPNVKLDLCVVEGTLRVNGWNRNEIRIFVKNGSGFNFERKDEGKDPAAWLKAKGADVKKLFKANPDCLWGDSIEIDAPVGASFEVKGLEYRAAFDSIKKAAVTADGGNIAFRNVSAGLVAKTGQGTITVEESRGYLDLATTTGNIIVIDVKPGEVGDSFNAKTTNGNITLEALEHGMVTVNSIAGTIAYTGAIRKAGDYTLKTQNGSIRLTLPLDTSCQIQAVYGFGTFSSEIPYKLLTEDVNMGPVKTKSVQLGKGGPLVKLQAGYGSIALKKMPVIAKTPVAPKATIPATGLLD